MSTAAAIDQTIARIKPGRIFSYRDIAEYEGSPGAVARAMSRLVDKDRVKRLSRGQFYIPIQGRFGEVSISDSELLKTVLYKNGKLTGYITGPALFNRLGLTTQLPKTITVATNGAPTEKDFGKIRIKLVSSRAPVTKANRPLLEYLDILKDFRKVPGADTNEVLKLISSRLAQLPELEVNRIQNLAIKYYPPFVRALLGLLSGESRKLFRSKLKSSLNPLSKYNLGLDDKEYSWHSLKAWNIQ